MRHGDQVAAEICRFFSGVEDDAPDECVSHAISAKALKPEKSLELTLPAALISMPTNLPSGASKTSIHLLARFGAQMVEARPDATPAALLEKFQDDKIFEDLSSAGPVRDQGFGVSSRSGCIRAPCRSGKSLEI